MRLGVARLNRILVGLAEEYRVPGLQFSLYHDENQITMSLGYERDKSGSRVSDSSVFAFGSITKVFIATVVMQLASMGDIALDEPLGEYVEEVGTSGTLGGRATMQELLSHSSGLPSDLDMRDLSARPLRAFAQNCRDIPLIGEPGESFSYSNVGYSLAARVLEVVTGMSWHEAVECFLLRPLGIGAAFCTDARFRLGPGAAISGHTPGGARGSLLPVDVYCPVYAAPGGGLCGSASDALKLGMMLSGAAAGSAQLLGGTARAAMYADAHASTPIGMADAWGLGVAKYGDCGPARWLGHNGSICGTTCNLRFNPDERAVLAVTTNSVAGLRFWPELVLRLREEGLPVGDYRPNLGTVVRSLPDLAPDDYLGEYVNGSLRYVIQAGANGALWLRMPGHVPARMTCYEDMTFTAEVGSGPLVGKLIRNAVNCPVESLTINGYKAIRVRSSVRS
jgi:CubicO group peptidase (beta-lactamase class C family)